jgi:predicted ester cyclase
VDEVMAPNYVYHNPDMEVKGPEGFKQFITMFRNAFPDLHVAIDDMVAEGDKVAACFTITGTHQGVVNGFYTYEFQIRG